MSKEKIILHVDVDAFFASVEQLLIPRLRNRPVVVGSGVIASCSYEARRFALHAGMPLHEARRCCPDAVFLRGSYPIYRCFADAIWDISRRFTCSLETYLDEAYGDATGMQRIHGDPPALGRKLQRQVREEVGLPVSVGLASNRMLSRIASASAKPDGVVWIPPGDERVFLSDLPVGKLPGVGRKTEVKLRDMNIRTVGDLRVLSRELLRCMFGRGGELLYERARGGDPAGLCPAHLPRTISRETTFHTPTCDPREIRGMLFYLIERAMRAVRDGKLLARKVELSIRYDDWKGNHTRHSLGEPTDCEEEVFAVVLRLLHHLHARRVALRHVGIVLSSFVRKREACELFEREETERSRRLHEAVDAIRDRYGDCAVVTGESISLMGHLEQNDYGFVLRTPSLTK